MITGLSKDSYDVIGFVIACLYSGAITDDDLKKWSENVIRDNDVSETPDYIFELVDFDGDRLNILNLIGFPFEWKASKSQRNALYGIALKRGEDLGDDCTQSVAMKSLEKHPEVEIRFRETFPFIDF
ncbi:hypothetical protein AV650_02290 [Serratia fonticola]|uniref:hypothetical protein n=1 Tax=Serratia fonticola TaxID=47917 RepID=UPI000742EE65|nr:hypothetical protein [Serratia fonticola]ALX92461.1 hypothetical protein AV650_02290 [Serratia fonticola]PAA96810.1 hypothetical protein CJJ13_15975 [Serratia fonticola]